MNDTPNKIEPESSTTVPQAPVSSGGPINLEQIRRMREAQQVRMEQDQNRQQRDKSRKNRPARDPNKPQVQPNLSGNQAPATNNQSPATESNEVSTAEAPPEIIDDEAVAPRYRSNKDSAPEFAKVPVPSARAVTTEEERRALEDELSGADLDLLMIGDKSVRVGQPLEDGSRHQGKVIKVHNANVFVNLGGPNEGVVPLLQFAEPPVEGQIIDFLIRAFNREEGLYELAIPGETVTVNDWNDLQEGAAVEAKIESANTGGVECKVGNVRGFIPMSQLSEFRIESAADFIGQKLICIITEANPRRGNLVLSHRAVLERDKAAKRKDRLAKLEIGEVCEGIVRKVMDFGAFVDIGGLDGMIHVSQLSWDKIKHPSEVVKEGDKIHVRVEKVDPETGKIGLSYRSLQDNPWSDVDARFPIGTVVRGTVTRLANFGAFVKIATGIEGLIHISELAHNRVASVGQILKEGQDVEVKILTVDRDSQRIGLSLKATQARPESAKPSESSSEQVDEPKRQPAVKKFQGSLKGGTGSNDGGALFGLKF
ncbi:MAG: S1 RNA-binding domain-containing protein [Pirellula sp.]